MLCFVYNFIQSEGLIMNEIMKFEDVEKRIITVNKQQVLIDRDVAEFVWGRNKGSKSSCKK